MASANRPEPVPELPGRLVLSKRTRTNSIKRQSLQSTPPYWQRHRSSSSVQTTTSIDRLPQIRLEDNSEPDSRTHRTLWAKSVSIEDYSIVRGNVTGIGSYVAWNCIVQTLDGGPITINKRYSEFDDLRRDLLAAFPQSTTKSLPVLPPKSAIYKFRANFLEKRRQGLAYFLHCVLLNPEYSSSDVVKNFIFNS